MQTLAAGLRRHCRYRAYRSLPGIAFSQVRILGVDIEWAVLWMAVPMLFFTVYLGFVNVRCFPMALSILKRALLRSGRAG
jgi:hypothetical protein